MKTVVLRNKSLVDVHQAQIPLHALPDVIMWRDCIYVRIAVQDSLGVYAEATVYAV